jgi:hypothetical protein
MNDTVVFIGIGTRRSGSSWLHSFLNKQTTIVKNEGGEHFFSENWSPNIDLFYKNLTNFTSQAKIVDLSVSYSYPDYANAVAKRIAEYCPNAKIFVIVRDPIDRMISDYRRGLSMFEIPKGTSLSEALSLHPELYTRSLYASNLAQFYNLGFDVKVFQYEKLVHDPYHFQQEIIEYFDIQNPTYIDPASNEKVGPAYVPKYQWLSKFIFVAKNTLRWIFNKAGCKNTWNNFTKRNQAFYQKLLLINSTKETHKFQIPETIHKEINADIELFRKMSNMSFSDWDINVHRTHKK